MATGGRQRSDRAVVALVGLFNALAASRTARFTESDPFWPWLWPWAFAVAAVATAWCLLRPCSSRAVAVSGLVTSAAYLARALCLWAAMVLGRAPLSDERAQLAAAMWLLLGVVVAFVWARVLRPLTHYRAAREA